MKQVQAAKNANKDIRMSSGAVEKFRQKLNKLPISDYHGLRSPGLTCYLNSVLQVLFMTEDFREAVKRCRSTESTTIDPHLGRLFTDLESGRGETHDVVRKLGITDVCKQRDAAEYLEKILCLSSPEASKIFKGELNHKATCLRCKEKEESRNSFWILPLAVEESYSVVPCFNRGLLFIKGKTGDSQLLSNIRCLQDRGLKAFLKGEKVRGDNKMYCDVCKKKEDAYLECEITQPPQILTLLLKRFTFDDKHMCFVKLPCKVDIPQTLHLESCTYDLYALVDHFGTLKSGHYTAQIRSFENKEWYCFDDGAVATVKPPVFGTGNTSVRSHTAYLLMYRKVNRHPKGDWKAHRSVEAEGRRDEAERRDARIPPRRPRDGSCNRSENLRHFSEADSSGRQDEQQRRRDACARTREERLPRTDAAAHGEKHRVQTHAPVRTETHDCIVTKMRGRSDEAGRRETIAVRNKREDVYCNGFPSSGAYLRADARSTTRKYKVQHVVTAETQTVTREKTASLRQKREAKKFEDKVKREPWR